MRRSDTAPGPNETKAAPARRHRRSSQTEDPYRWVRLNAWLAARVQMAHTRPNLPCWTQRCDARSVFSRPNTTTRRQEMIKVSVMYPNTPGARFNHEYYRDKHMPPGEDSDGRQLQVLHGRQGTGRRNPGSPATYVGMCHIFCDSVEAFQAGFGPHAQEIMDDIPNYTDLSPVIQISEVIVGKRLTSNEFRTITEGSTCGSTLAATNSPGMGEKDSGARGLTRYTASPMIATSHPQMPVHRPVRRTMSKCIDRQFCAAGARVMHCLPSPMFRFPRPARARASTPSRRPACCASACSRTRRGWSRTRRARAMRGADPRGCSPTNTPSAST